MDNKENFDDLQQPERSAGIGGLGDRSSSADLSPARQGAGIGVNPDDTRTPLSGDPLKDADHQQGDEEETGHNDPLGLGDDGTS